MKLCCTTNEVPESSPNYQVVKDIDAILEVQRAIDDPTFSHPELKVNLKH